MNAAEFLAGMPIAVGQLLSGEPPGKVEPA
jgi:hypothetical protein